MKVDKVWFKRNQLVPEKQIVSEQAPKEALNALRKEIMALLTRQRFVSFAKQARFYYDNQLNCLWLFYDFKSSPEEMFQYVTKLKIYAFNEWEIPNVDQLRSMTLDQLYEDGEKLHGVTALSSTPSRAKDEPNHFKTVTIGYGATGSSDKTHTIIPIHQVAQRDIFSFILAHSLMPKNVPGIEQKLKELYRISTNVKEGKPMTRFEPSLPALKQTLLEGDYIRARLPVLEPAYLYDMGKGLWELHQPTRPTGEEWQEVSLKEPWEARNPEMDVRDGVVAIDFGTSSTVVAYREHGKTVLLRVGMNDFYQVPKPEDYQNPTTLTFLNLPDLMLAWNTEAYRPMTRWEDFHFSHQALSQFRENEADRRVVASVLTAIKQLPLQATASDFRLRITDQGSGAEMDIRPGNNPMPVRGQPITVSEGDALDPIELYAYYLGLFINHRANGLFLEYHMTFPITYPKEIKQQILSSFARGLQRSLPLSLINSHKMQRFVVQEEASEPAAYAACALGELEIEATEDGTAYAVFDFGGGTTDFDFGIYRQPTEEEEDQGYEKVIKHFGASGDMYLGGENLVAHLAYLTFQHNLDSCRQNHIPFSRPQEAELFPGHEMFIDNSHVAQTNNSLLMAKVRPLWEGFMWQVKEEVEKKPPKKAKKRRRLSDRISDALCRSVLNESFQVDPLAESVDPDEGMIKVRVELLNRSREKVPVTLTIDRNRLNHFLTQRIGQGIHRFFIAMRQAFDSHGFYPEQVHILQAGNASRSLLVQALFAAILQKKMVGWTPTNSKETPNPAMEKIREAVAYSRFMVHRPPPEDPNNPYKPTAKTGVAIGLLKLIPGETLLAITPQQDDMDAGEAPFRYFVGRLKKGHMTPILKQNGPYQQWFELGIPTRGVFNLIYSSSPQAGLGTLKRGSSDLQERSLRFYQGFEGKRLYIRAIGPTTVEVFMADALEQILKQPEKIAHREVIELTN
ncbi:MAG: hypothetical protein HQL53_01525 [Magnetococcales bacterium]|nr:hypothetical protein [Magnetococcales bacterium]